MSQASTQAAQDGKDGKDQHDATLVEGSLWRAIWVMSWPLLLTTICSSLVGLADMKVAGHLGSAQQAAVGVSEQIIFIFMVFILSTGVGTTAIVSRAYGAKKLDEASFATAQSLAFAVIMGLLLSVVSSILARYGIAPFNQSPEVIAYGRQYLGIYTLFLIPFSVNAISNAAFRAIGAAKLPLVMISIVTCINIIGDYLTVFGNWPVPGLGIKGVALSGVVASLCGSIITLTFLSRSPLKSSLLKLFPFSREMITRVVKIGVPSACQRICWSLSVFVIFFILGRCPNPTQTLASWAIGMRVEALVFMPLMALSLAVGSIVGQNLGAKKPARAVQAGWQVTWIGVWMMVVAAVVLFTLAPQLAHSMSDDPLTIKYTELYLRVNACGEPFLAVGMILSGALQGAGDTKTPMWISIISHWLVRLPLAWLLADTLKWGPQGAWIAMVSSTGIMACLVAMRYRSNSWLKTDV